MSTQITKFTLLRFVLYSGIILCLLACAAYLYFCTPVRPTRLNKKPTGDYAKVFSGLYEQELANKKFYNGADLQSENADEYLSLVQKIFDMDGIKTVVDFGCGDWRLMQDIKIPQNKIYVGYEVVPRLVVSNNVRYGDENINFFEVSTLEDFKWRDLQADVLILKDVLHYWPEKDIQYFIKNILPNFKYALITNDYSANAEFNQDVPIGGLRPLDLAKPPYSLENLEVLTDYPHAAKQQKRVYLYTNPNNHVQISLRD